MKEHNLIISNLHSKPIVHLFFIFFASTFFVKAIFVIVASALFIMSSSEIYVQCVSSFKELHAQDHIPLHHVITIMMNFDWKLNG